MTDAQTRVPAGHQVTIYSATLQPAVARSNGGVVLANFGCAGDDPDRELEAILRSLAEAVRGDVTPTFLVNAGKPVTVSDLVVPAQPAVARLESPVLWVFHQGGAASLCSTPDAFASADARDEQLIPLRSPHLGRLVLELHARNNGDVNEIVQALKDRTLPLMLIVDPATRGVAQRSFGNQVAIPTFSDMPTLQRAAREMGMAANSYGIAMFDARALFAMAESQRVAVAICAYRESTPLYAVVRGLG